MMEKNGMLTLTSEEMETYKDGKVPDRVVKEWELDFNSLDSMIKAGSFQVIGQSADDND